MNVGLPGAGIGGLYYLICTAIMPFKEMFTTFTKPNHQFRYRLVFSQFSIASGIILGFIGIYKLLNTLFKADLSLQVSISNIGFLPSYSLPVVISLALLVFILVVIEVFAFVYRKKDSASVKK